MPAEISVVVPMHNEEKNLEAFFARLIPVLEKVTPQWEVVCVDDGSTDATYTKVYGYYQLDQRIKVISFPRNFGKELAVTAGLDMATGKAVIPMDADLQDPPELIEEMVTWWKKGHKVVLAVRKSRNKDNWFKRLSAKWFYHFVNVIATVNIPKDAGDFRLLDREVVDVICLFRERTRFMKGIFSWPGFTPKVIYFDRGPRYKGAPQQSFLKLFHLAWDGIVSFSSFPLVMWIYVGGAVSLIAFIYACIIIGKTLVFGVDLPGYASLMVTVLFLGGMQLISLGIIGQYLSKVFRETKQRPLYVISKRHGFTHTH